MSEYTSEVTGILVKEHHSRGDGSVREYSLGGIVVRPPIEVKDVFYKAILGSRPIGILMREVAHTADASIFVAESHLGDAEKQEATLRKIAERIGRLANNPESVCELMSEEPFGYPTVAPV